MATTEEQLANALARIAALESTKAPPKEPAFDQKAFSQAFTRDPAGMMKRFGIDREHATQVLVAQALKDSGQTVPQGLEAAVAMGPVMEKLDSVTAELAELRQFRQQSEKASRGSTIRESLKILAADKKQNPHLATAYAADPDLFDEDVDKHEGSAADLAKALEARLARQAKALGAPQSASTEKVDDTETAQRPRSTDGTAMASKSPAGDPPTLPKVGKTKGFDENDQAALKAEIIANAERGVYDNHPYKPQ